MNILKYYWIFLIVTVLGIGLWNFQTNPGFWFDEGIIAQPAKNLALNGIYGVQTAPDVFYRNNFWITSNYSLVFPLALSFKIFGVSIWAARLVPFLYLTLLVIVSYFFIKNLYGFNIAVYASLLLLTFAPLYGNGKAVLGEIPGLLWLLLGALLYLLYEKNKKTTLLLLTAVSWGIGVSTKPYYLLFIPSVVWLLLFLWLWKKNINYKTAALFCIIFSAPIFLWLFFAFDFSSSDNLYTTIVYFLNSYSASSFEPLKNLFRFISESTPIHFTVLGTFVFVAWCIQRYHNIKTPPLILAFFIFIALSFLWYLKTPGWYRYFFSIHILIILLFPAALHVVTQQLASFFKKQRLIYSLGMVGVGSLILFQGGFLMLHYNDFYNDAVLKFKRYAEQNLPQNASIFVASKPEIAFILENKNVYQHIFINQNLIIGENVIGKVPVQYLITGQDNDQFIIENDDLIKRHYLLEQELDHYRVYRSNNLIRL